MFSQQPAVPCQAATFGCVSTPPPNRLAFSQRLAELCEEMGLPKRGRQTRLAQLFKVSQQAARKWLDAESFPMLETLVEIADWADVNINWLLQGAGPKRGNRIDTKALILDEAVHSLTPALGADLLDSLRAKLIRLGKLSVEEPNDRYMAMLRAYEHDLQKNKP